MLFTSLKIRASRTPCSLATLGLLAYITLPIGGCGPLDGSPTPRVPGGETAPYVVNGQAHAGHPSVGKLLRSTALCTATLIGSRTVVTAAHCVDVGSWHSFVADGIYYSVDTVIPHPSYSDTTYANDIAVVRLASAPPITPSPVSTRAPAVGQEVTIVGFGRTTESGPSDSGIKRIAQNVVDALSATRITIWGSANGAGNICNGDSGGPSFATFDGQEVQVGVHSVKFSSCGTGGADTRIDAFLPWVLQMAGGDVLQGPQQPDPQEPDPQQPDPQEPDPQQPDPQEPDPQQPEPPLPPPPPPPAPDADGDGIPDAQDFCSYTPQGKKPWPLGSAYAGCAGGQYQDIYDIDRDGIPNQQDACSKTPIGAKVWTSGYWTGCAGGQHRDEMTAAEVTTRRTWSHVQMAHVGAPADRPIRRSSRFALAATDEARWRVAPFAACALRGTPSTVVGNAKPGAVES